MSPETFIWIGVAIVVALLVLAAGYTMWARKRREHLRERFGPEYDRTVQESESTRDAERELQAREERHAKLQIKPLRPEARDEYAREWTALQERFVDAPTSTVVEADRLVASVMAVRGYPLEEHEQRVADLSIEHGRTMDHYREAHDISGRATHDQASTEELRQAMVHYRTLFDDLLVTEEPEDSEKAEHKAKRS